MCRFEMVIVRLVLLLQVSVLPVAAELASDTHELPDYEVTATLLKQPDLEVPFAVSVLDAEDIQRASMLLGLDESLQTVPGVFVLNPYNFAQDSRIAIRGFGARANFGIRGIRLVADGIPATTADGQGSVDALDLGSAEQIQVFRGPASAIYGAAAGGVILVDTESGPAVPFAEAGFMAGEHGLRQMHAKFGGQRAELDYLLNANVLNYEGYRAHSETENFRLNTKLGYAFSSQAQLTALVNLIDIPLQNDPGGLTLEEARDNPAQARQQNVDYDSGESVQQATLGLRYALQFDESHGVELDSYYQQRAFENRLPFESGGQVEFDRDFWGIGGRYRFEWERVEGVLGTLYDRQQDDRSRFDNLSGVRGDRTLEQEELIQNVGLYAVSSYRPLEALAFSAALRQDFARYEVADRFLSDGDDSGRRNFDQTSPMAGAIWRVLPDVGLYANVSRSFEAPTTTELANPDGGGFNPNLNPERALSYELGLKGTATLWGERALRVELAAYHIDLTDAIVPYELAGGSERTYFRNAGESERRGVEAAVGMDLWPDLWLDLSYTWSDFRYVHFVSDDGDFSGNQLPGIPEHFVNVQVKYAHGSGFYGRWNTRLVGRMQADDANTTMVDGSVVSDVRVGIERAWGAWQVEPYIGLNNVFDEAYFANIRINARGGRYYEPAPERNFFAGVRVRYAFR